MRQICTAITRTPPEKIRGAMSAALEQADLRNQELVVLYEPLTNRRQYFMMDDYGDCFSGASKVYWLPIYLAREDPDQPVLEPSELITHLSDPSIAVAAKKDEQLVEAIKKASCRRCNGSRHGWWWRWQPGRVASPEL